MRLESQTPLFPQSIDEKSSNTIASPSRLLLTFSVLVLVLSIPFYMAGALTKLQLFPGLPVSGLALVCPLIAASILVYRENKTAGVIVLLKRSFDYKRVKTKVWYLPVIFLIPVANVLAYGLMRLMGLPLPVPRFPVLAAPVMFMAFFVGALGEELGWSGYVLEPLQARWSALQAGILLGMVWAVWHWVPLIQAHRSPVWIAWWSLGTVSQRVLITWLYNNTGKSVFAVALYHDISNLSWQLFPNYGSHWDPRISGMIIAFAATVVTVVWGPKSLARPRDV